MLARKFFQESPERLLSTEIRDFDYSTLDTETRSIVQMRTSEIRSLVNRQTQDAFDIGQKLLEVKTRLGYGHFRTWLKLEFEWSHDTANRFMNVAKHLGQMSHCATFEARALYLLASPSTPEEARQEAKERAGRGEKITFSKAKAIRSHYNDADIAGAKTRRDKRVTVDAVAPTVEYESSIRDKTEDEDEFAEVEPTRYATPPQAPKIVEDAPADEDEDKEQDKGELTVERELPTDDIAIPKALHQKDKVEESPLEKVPGEYSAVSAPPQKVNEIQTSDTNQSEQKLEDPIEVSVFARIDDDEENVSSSPPVNNAITPAQDDVGEDPQTALESIYLFLISEAKEYLPKFPNLKFSEVNLVIKQVAANARLDDTATLVQLTQKHIEEFLKTVVPRSTADQIVNYLSSDQKEKLKNLL